ncbi:imidazoleglycerol-phosphate dehydratase, partial [Neisseria gonorrhoeae]
MTKTQLHLNNFLTLAQEADSLPKLAKLCGYRTPVALYKLKQRLEKQAEDPDARGIRPSLMAKLEKHTGKPKGWLDRKHRERT